MKTQEARDLGKRIAAHVHADEIEAGYALLAPVLAERTPFRLLGLIGETVGAGPLESSNRYEPDRECCRLADVASPIPKRKM
jgi:hypothetical protein